MRYNRDNVSVLAILDKRRAKKSGLYPVKIEVIYKRVQKYYPILVDMSEEEWQSVAANWQNLTSETSEVRRKFANACREVNYILDRGEFTFEELDRRYRSVSELTLDRGMDIMRSEFYCDGKINSALMIKYAMECVQRFGGVGIRMETVTAEWLSRFEKFILSEGKSIATVDIYMKAIKSTVRRAIAMGYISPSMYPFGRDRYFIPKGSARTGGLSLADVEKVKAYKGSKSVEKYRDLWLFSYYGGGINFRDMLFFQYKNVVEGEICYMPTTITVRDESKIVHIPYTDEMKTIVARWGNPYKGKPGAYLFKYVKGRETEVSKMALVRKVVCLCNRALKKISAETGVPAFTTLSARRSER